MDMFDRLDPELVDPLKGVLEAMGGGIDLRDVPGMRVMADGIAAAVKEQAPPVEGIDTEDLAVPGPPGAPDIHVRLYRPAGAATPLPVLQWMHPGGFAFGSIELDDLMTAQIAKDVGCAVVSVDYRLAPENPFPAAIDDCYAVLGWLARDGGDYGIDAGRIAVGGASAGGGLAAGLAIMARDRGGPSPVLQLLIYPCINDQNVAPADDKHPDTLFWNRANNRLAWQAYLGTSFGAAEVSPYAAPCRSIDLGRLAPAFIAVGELDLFANDNAEYAQRLIAAEVPTELHIYPGAFHGFDAFAPMSRVSQGFVAARDGALKRALHG